MSLTIPVNKLPSQGRDYKINNITLTPMTFKQMLEYEDIPANTYVQRLRRDLNLLAGDVDLNEVNSFDVDALIFLKKSASFTNTTTVTFSFKCTHCGDLQTLTINLENLNYKFVDQEIFNISKIQINGVVYPVFVPSAQELLATVDKFNLFHEKVSPFIVALCNVLQFTRFPNIKQVIENATLDETLMLRHLADFFMGARKLVTAICDHCGKEVQVEVDMLAPNMFQDLRLNQKIKTDKIRISKAPLPPGHNK